MTRKAANEPLVETAHPPLRLPLRPAAEVDSSAPGDALLARIAGDRRLGALPEQIVEQDLMQRYGLTRAAVQQALGHLAGLSLVQRRLGCRWRFCDPGYNLAAQHEAMRFRRVVEPSALLQPGFALPAGWIDTMGRRHQAFLDRVWTPAASVSFFEMNAAFHEGLVAGAGNRFFVEAIRLLNQKRRLANYDWRHGARRVSESCQEHLAILACVERGDMGGAASLMRDHLG